MKGIWRSKLWYLFMGSSCLWSTIQPLHAHNSHRGLSYFIQSSFNFQCWSCNQISALFFLPRKSPNKQKTEKGRIKYSLISKLQKIAVLEPPSKIALHKYIDKKWYIQVLQKPYEERMIKIWIKLRSFSSFLSKIKEEIGYKYPRNKWLLCCRIF